MREREIHFPVYNAYIYSPSTIKLIIYIFLLLYLSQSFVFLCGQVEKSSLRLFREGRVYAIWAFSAVHKLHLPVVGEYICAFSKIFHITMWFALLSFSFQMCSLCDVADDLCLSLKRDVCWLYRVLNFKEIVMEVFL